MIEDNVTVEQIEQEAPTILEGTLEHPQQKQRIFRSLSALTDYARVFNIESFQCSSGILQGSDEKVFQLTYLPEQ